jgi:ketosteroid isomerase-like protein
MRQAFRDRRSWVRAGRSLLRVLGKLALLTPALAVLAGCTFGKPAPPVVLAAGQVALAISDGETRWNADLAARDPAKTAAHYGDNAMLVVPGLAGPILGRAAIQATWSRLFADPNFSFTFRNDTDFADIGGDLAYTTGPFTETFSDPRTGAKVTVSGAYLKIYRPTGPGSGPSATWTAVEDIATADASLAAASTGGRSQ